MSKPLEVWIGVENEDGEKSVLVRHREGQWWSGWGKGMRMPKDTEGALIVWEECSCGFS